MHDPNKGTRARRPGTSSKALSVIQNSLPSPCKGLHTSRPAAHPGMVLRFALPLPAKTGDRSALSPPQNGREVAVGSGILRPLHPELPPQFPKNRSVKCAAFNADLVAAPAPCRSGCRGEAPCPSETPIILYWYARGSAPDGIHPVFGRRRDGSGGGSRRGR